MKKLYFILVTVSIYFCVPAWSFLRAADINEPRQSTTGPVPPQSVLDKDKAEIKRLKSLTFEQQQQFLTNQHTIAGVPEYFWRHGCGPTAVGMVVGYYDIHGYGDLVSGDASTQTAAVNQAIASGGDSANPNPPGSERHYEDYARPEDSYPNMLQDDYIGKRSPHSNNCIADYMDTSKSTRSNYYGWSWSSDVGPSFINYSNQQNSSYSPTYTAYYWSGGTLTWDVLKNEIDHNRPMVFLVDTDGDGSTDHFVPIIGYDDGSPHQYACYTTWPSMPGIRWYTFQGTGNPWGIWGGWSFALAPDLTPPTINAFSVSPTSVNVGTSVTISYTASDTGGSGLKTAQLWRAPDDGYGVPGTWEQIGSLIDISAAGDGPFNGSFSDTPPLVGSWWYGVHVNDGASPSNWNDERNSQTDGVHDLGPIQVTVSAAPTGTYGLVFNTSGVQTTYAGYNIPAYTCVAYQNGWSDACATGYLASDGVVVFNFPSGFNYDGRYDIIVVPAYRATDICSPTYPDWFPTPLAINVTGNFYFDGRVQIAGDDILTTTQDVTFARSGGFPGPKHNQDVSIFNDRSPAITDYWTIYDMPAGYHGRFGTSGIVSGQTIYVPTDLAKRTFGPGQPVNPPYKGGGGGGSGGIGGEAGRGYFHGVYTAGPSYGDKEVPVPFGGSAGGWGGGISPGGAAGGGGIEIVATGNVVLDSNSQINAHGGGQLCSAVNYPAGGGGGGSVRIIAGGSVTNKGVINVNGGKGGNGSMLANTTGGGGGGGRVAIFYGTTYSNTGTITANGGARGTYNGAFGLAQKGQNGTIYIVNSSTISPQKASAPEPVNGERMVYCYPDPCTGFQLQWYSGYGGTTDRVYCDTFSPPTTQRGGNVAATRGQKSVTMAVSSGNTYYWKVVTDANVSSDTWSFRTVNWRCRQYDGADVDPTDPLHVSGPEWDSNRDCVLDFEDFLYFTDDWLNPAFDIYTLDMGDLSKFASEWLECYNRTNNGCASW